MFLHAEVGPIRPPSESGSFLVRLNRNCPWNKCLFCPVYKNKRFSIRPLEDIRNEIKSLASLKDFLKKQLKIMSFVELNNNLSKLIDKNACTDARRILHWLYHKEYTVFLQDADPLLRKKEEIFDFLKFLKSHFPEVTRITAYARAKTINRFSSEELKGLHAAGLNRIHMGLESGSDEVLKLVCKGLNSRDIIEASRLLKVSNIEVSLYIIPGLGGVKFSKEHVEGTIETINKAMPDFVRIRSLGLMEYMPLYKLYKDGTFKIIGEEDMVKEIKDIISGINVNLQIYSDHNLNLLMELNGKLPDNKDKMINTIDHFLSLSEKEKILFILSRRFNRVFELNEFFSFPIDDFVYEQYESLKHLSKKQREDFFLYLRSQNL